MTSATPLGALQNAGLAFDAGADAAASRTGQLSNAPAILQLSLHGGLEAIEAQWRRFERLADCTPFQTFDWLQTWHRHIGRREQVQPVIAVASFVDGETAFLLPLAVECKRAARRLCWLGQDVNDYNAPLIARDFSQRVSPDRFLAAWSELRARMQRDPMLRHDWIELEKMPQTIGGQINPFFNLRLATNPSGAHFTRLGSDWKKFYAAKRSSATRRRDRAKRKHLAEFGEISFLTSADADDARRTLEILMEQKSRLFAHKGIPDMFARPGWREFFLDIAANLPPPCPAPLASAGSLIFPPPLAGEGRVGVHTSRVQFGTIWGAVNLGVVFRDTYYHMLASYDDGGLSRYGPGALHLRELLTYAIGSGLRRFDFTIGDESYKLEWSDTHVKLCDYTTAATWRGWPACCRSMVRRPVKRFIKQTPFVWRAVSRVRARLGPLLQRPRPLPSQESASGSSPSRAALACVMGDMDLLRPIASAGISCAVVTRPGVPSLYSRYARSRLLWDDFSHNVEALVEQLVRFGKAQPEPPVLVYEEDAQLLLVSRFRENLAQAFRFVIADAPLVDDLVDKARFQILAERHGLPVPPARPFHPAALAPENLELRFPLILKPLTRLHRWNENAGLRKALAADGPDALRALWPRLIELDVRSSRPGTRSRRGSANRKLPLLRRSARQHRRRVHRAENPHLSGGLRPHHGIGDHRCGGRATARPRYCGTARADRRRQVRLQARPGGQAPSVGDQSPLQPVAPRRSRCRRQHPRDCLCRSDRHAAAADGAGASGRALVPHLEGLSRGADDGRLARPMAAMGLALRDEVKSFLG